MHEAKQTIANLFAAFAEALNAMDDREFDLLLRGEAKLRLVEKRPGKNGKNGRLLTAAPLPDALPELAEKFQAAASREEAAALLAAIAKPRRKETLLLLAKEFSVNATARDNIEQIERQLIENVVGARLTSEAIRTVAF